MMKGVGPPEFRSGTKWEEKDGKHKYAMEKVLY